MLKKMGCLLLAGLIVCFCLLPAAAQDEAGVITLRLNSSIAGRTERDVEQLIEIKSGHVVYSTYRTLPVSVSDYAGTPQNASSNNAKKTQMLFFMINPPVLFLIRFSLSLRFPPCEAKGHERCAAGNE